MGSGSLSGRLYKKKGADAQPIHTQKSAQTTELYADIYGSEWISLRKLPEYDITLNQSETYKNAC